MLSRRAVLGITIVTAALGLVGGSASIASSPIRQLTQTASINVRPAWSPDEKQIAFQSNRDGPYHIYVMDADGTNARRITSGDADDRHPAWSPDGRFVAVDSGDSSGREIWVIDVASLARRQITTLGGIANFPSWSSDGKHLAFYEYVRGTMDVWTVGADGSAPTQLTHQLASEQNDQCTFACHSPAWSLDGRSLAFTNGDQNRVMVMATQAVDTATAISPDGESSHFPVYLADGKIAYVTEHIDQTDSYTDLWEADPGTGGQRTQLAQGILAQGPFELSPDASKLLFASPRSGNFEIYEVTLDAAGKAALAQRQPSGAPATGPSSTAGFDVSALAQGRTPYVLGGGLLMLLVAAGLATRRRPTSR